MRMWALVFGLLFGLARWEMNWQRNYERALVGAPNTDNGLVQAMEDPLPPPH